jgi:hypothetical protein
MRFASQGASSESAIAAMMAGSIQRWCKCAMTITPSTVPMASGTKQRRFASQSIRDLRHDQRVSAERPSPAGRVPEI